MLRYSGGASCASEFAKEIAAALRSAHVGCDRQGGDLGHARISAPASSRVSGVTHTHAGSLEIAPTLLDLSQGGDAVPPERDKRKDDLLVLPLDACPKRPKMHTSQPRWAHRSKT
eukprot:6477651-Amphidinium_carterae.1